MNKKIITVALLSLLTLSITSGCKEQDVPDTSISVLGDGSTDAPLSAFDLWLRNNYTYPYNIDVKYKLTDKEVDYAYLHAPAKLENSMKLMQIIKHVWIDAYNDEAGISFMQSNDPRILMLIGSPAYNNDGTFTLGTAEGGLKVTLYMVNWLNEADADALNTYYLHTMHHEFTHILHQNKPYPVEYNTISKGNYAATSWHDRDAQESAQLGFITPYAGSQPIEDITEVTSAYLTFTDEEWSNVLNNLSLKKDEKGNVIDDSGQKVLNEKVNIMKKYMKEAWNIDMDHLRQTIQRKMRELNQLQLIQDDWKPLLRSTTGTNSLRGISIAPTEDIYKIGLQILSTPQLYTVPAYWDGSNRCQLITQFVSPCMCGTHQLDKNALHNDLHPHTH